jgi:hypothetical protein
MSTIVLRSVKNAPLTNAEVDANFTNLNNDKTELGGTYSAGTANGVLFLSASKVLTTGSALTFDGTQFVVAGSTRVGGTGSQGALATYAEGTGVSIEAFQQDTPATKRDIYLNAFGGNVAIGSTTASGRLDVIGSIGTFRISTTGDTATFTNNGSNFVTANGASGSLNFQTGGSNTRYTISSDGTAIWSVGGSEQMRLTSTGLGIGTSSPAYKLSVSNTSGVTAGLDKPTGASLQFDASGVSDAQIGGNAAGSLLFYTGSSLSEKMRIDSSGNLGLGVTPSAWASNAKVFQVGATSSFVNSGAGDTSIGENRFFNGTNNIYLASTFASIYQQTTGQHRWFTAPSGTAGDAISFSQVMTLDVSGNLGVGETSPTSRLHLAFTSNSVDATLRVQQKGNNTAAGITLSANDDNGAGYNFIQSETTSGTAHWRISGGVATSTMAFSTGGSERARITSGGDLVVGQTTSVPYSGNTGSTNFTLSGTSNPSTARPSITLKNSDDSVRAWWVIDANNGAFIGTQSNNYFGFQTNNTERARIDSSGNLLVGTTSLGNTHAYFEQSSVDRAILNLGTSSTLSDLTLANFRTPNGTVGTITVSSTSTAYNTSSDYRLKNTIAPMTGALAKVALLKPCTYKWNADGSDGEGFIAHELAEVVPQAVTGEKDAVDAEDKPQYQGIDTSFLVATLTAAIQEQQAIINSLKARLDAANL